MKVYILVDIDAEIVAVYDSSDLAIKMKPVIERKLETTIEIVIQKVNPDIKIIRR